MCAALGIEARALAHGGPPVAKVRAEARRYAARGDLVALIGHAGHEEAEGTLGEAPRSTVLVQTPADAAEITRRFPDARGPHTDDICSATTNRQRAVTRVAREAALVLVVGSANSSDSRRLVEVAEQAGAPALLIDGPADVPLDRLRDARTVGVTGGASAPPAVLDAVVAALRGLGPADLAERAVTVETIEFTLPKEVRP